MILIMLACAAIGIYAVNPGLFGGSGSAPAGEEAEGEVNAPEEPVSPTAGLIPRPPMPSFAPPAPEEPVEEESPLPELSAESIDPEAKTAYVPPSPEELQVPEELLTRTGLTPVEEKEHISGGEADRLSAELSTGNTGDGLEFDPLFYPHYQMLDEEGKKAYRQIYANANDLLSSFAPAADIGAGGLKNAFSAVVNDHPELFWLDTAYGGMYTDSGSLIGIELSFNRTASGLDQARQNLERSAQGYVEEAQKLSAEEDKEKLVHDLLAKNTEYDLNAEMNQSAYSALVGGKTVCAGYSRAFQYILMQLGIPCYYCTGYAGESHAWNIARIDGVFYNVDTTWDDAGSNYSYYNKSDSDFSATHIRTELGVYLPPCNDSKASPEGERIPGTEDASPEGSAGEGEAVVEGPLSIRKTRRTLEEAGADSYPMISGLDQYYAECTDRILSQGLGNYSFYTVIQGEKLFGEIYSDYVNDFYKQAYMDHVMEELGAAFAEIRFDSEELEGGYYLIRHGISITD